MQMHGSGGADQGVIHQSTVPALGDDLLCVTVGFGPPGSVLEVFQINGDFQDIGSQSEPVDGDGFATLVTTPAVGVKLFYGRMKDAQGGIMYQSTVPALGDDLLD